MTFRRGSNAFHVVLLLLLLLLAALMVALKRDPFSFLRRAFTVTQQEALRFANFSYMLDHPDKCSGQDVHLLVFVKSAPKNADRRQAIRDTWGNEAYIRRVKGITVKVLFALGAPMTSDGQRVQRDIQDALEREDGLHGDLVQQDFADSFRNLTLKVLMQLRWAHQRCGHARFFMTTDDDVLVHTPNLADYLADAAKRNLWVGCVFSGSPPIRDRNSKYYLSEQVYPWSLYPDYMSGTGYVMSLDVVEKIYQASLTLDASIHMDDVVVGIGCYLAGVLPQHHAPFMAGLYAQVPRHLCVYRHMMTSHGEHRGRDMYELWAAATDPSVKRMASEANC